jgi:WhiB family redox-sensing transcriptional regulator
MNGGRTVSRRDTTLSSFARTQCLRLPPPKEDAWNWQLRGSCRGYPAETFFPECYSRSEQRKRENAAKVICRQCPVLEQCRAHALRTPETHGVWGAMTAGERARALLRRHEYRPAVSPAGVDHPA